MTIIRVPTEIAVSPESGTQMRFDTDDTRFYDEHDNDVSIIELAKCNLLVRVTKWLRDNYPED